MKNRKTLREKIQNGHFVVTAELGPPRGANGDSIRRKAEYFRHIDGVNITDNQTAIVRLSSIAAASILMEEGIEPVIQVSCRDRNRIAIQSDLLGAASLGIENVLCLTGDHPRFGDHPEARGVFDLDSVQLISMVRKLNEGYFLSGDPLKGTTCFLVGGAANPFAEPLNYRVKRLAKKIRAGAEFIQTQPIFHPERFERWWEDVVRQGLQHDTAILGGVMPVKSVRALVFMQEQVPGMCIDKRYIQRMESAADPQKEGVTIAVEIIDMLRHMEGIAGVHLMPLLWEKITPRLLEQSGLLPV